MSTKRSRLRALLFLPAAVLSVLAVLLLAGIIHSLPQRAAGQFGPPDPALTPPKLQVLSLKLILQGNSLTRPAEPQGAEFQLEIDPGESITSILTKLTAAGLINDPAVFKTYLVYSGAHTKIQAGTYRLKPDLSPLEIADLLQDPAPGETILTILPGWRGEEIAEAFPGAGLSLSGAEFIDQVYKNSREGYLFPGSYQVARDIRAEALLEKLVAAFHENLDGPLLDGFQQQGLTIHEAVTLASIVEREAVREEEKALIASVFLNRLEQGMPLEADPTVQYARGFNDAQGTWWTNPISQSDLNLDSPYNTYQVRGLPPGPICNPGSRALEAVAYPADTDFYYFRAACDGSGYHVFSEDYSSHLEAACP